ncbi:hypothetical protein ACLOJK_021811 [Asimina triloba]
MNCNAPPPKPYERAGTSSGPAPFKPPSAGNTSDVVEASRTARPGEIVSTAMRNSPVNTNALGRPVPSRPWEQNYGNSYGATIDISLLMAGYGSGLNYNSGYGSGGMYGSYGGLGGSYGGGLYGNSMQRSPYGGYGGGMYGGGMYNSGFGGPMGGYGMGMGMGMGGPYGDQDPNNPFGPPPSPPGFWISFLRVMQGVVTFFGRISILIDQNTQAFHMFMSALLQVQLRTHNLFDRSGMLYGELARFVLRLLGIKTKRRMPHEQGPGRTTLRGQKLLPVHGRTFGEMMGAVATDTDLAKTREQWQLILILQSQGQLTLVCAAGARWIRTGEKPEVSFWGRMDILVARQVDPQEQPSWIVVEGRPGQHSLGVIILLEEENSWQVESNLLVRATRPRHVLKEFIHSVSIQMNRGSSLQCPAFYSYELGVHIGGVAM